MRARGRHNPKNFRSGEGGIHKLEEIKAICSNLKNSKNFRSGLAVRARSSPPAGRLGQLSAFTFEPLAEIIV